jgi:hypothetical protein
MSTIEWSTLISRSKSSYSRFGGNDRRRIERQEAEPSLDLEILKKQMIDCKRKKLWEWGQDEIL